MNPHAPVTEPPDPSRIKIPRALSMTIHDLSKEVLLTKIPRVEMEGNSVPFLGGIPLFAKLGEGAMGAVYWGYHPKLKKEVAVKLLRLGLDDKDKEGEFVKRFKREARLAMMVESPHLVKVHELVEEWGRLAMIMEYVKSKTAGEAVDELMEEGEDGVEVPGMDEVDALDACIAAAKGLGAAHEKGIIHRDIKPDNILIPERADGTLDFSASKLSDLGISRTESSKSALTQSQIFMGSPGFMSPEQAQQFKDARQPADVFSMGATLYCLLSGRPPFDGKTPIATIINTVEQPHDSILVFRPNLSFSTVRLIDRCLDKDLKKRYAHGMELACALEECRESLEK